MTPSVEDLLASYRSTAVAWHEQRHDARKANPLFIRLHGIYQQLRREQAGRDGIAALMEDENVGVRLKAATHSLGWAPNRAMDVLEEIQAGPGLVAVTAEYTLKAFREGKLKLD